MKTTIKLFMLFILIFCGYLYFFRSGGLAHPQIIERVRRNYVEEARIAEDSTGVPKEFLMALIALECSGLKPAKSRFESGVYDKLLQLQKGKIKSYDKLTSSDLLGYTDKELRWLASSWGPLQIMGYHCIRYKFNLEDLKGNKALTIGAKWCLENYGTYIERLDYRNAFHMHNTGKPHPTFSTLTYDPLYVENGIEYVKAFQFETFAYNRKGTN